MATSRSRSKGSRYLTPLKWKRTSYVGKLAHNPPPYDVIYDTQELEISQNVYYDDREAMSDTVGYFDRFNGCTHTKPYAFTVPQFLGAKNVKVPPATWFNTGWKTYGTDCGHFPGHQIWFQGLYSSGYLPIPTFPGADWSTLVNSVGLQLDGRMTTGQNLLVSLAEVSKTIGMIKNPFNLRNMPKQLKKLSPGQGAKSAASAWLEYRYGWSNLYRDIKQLYDVWSEVRQHREYLEATANRFISVSNSKSYEVSNPSVGLSGVGDPYYVHYQPKVTRVTRVDRFSLDIKREAHALAWSTFDQVCARLGVNNVAEALWDLVPLSFVVDWFTHVNKLIARKSIDWSTYDLRRIGYSQTYEWYGVVNFTSKAYAYDSSLKTVSGTSGEQLVQKKYLRSSGFPPATATVGLFGNLNKVQIADGAALLVQRLL